MYKSLLAGLTAMSLTLSPAPVMANGLDEDQLGRLLFGLAVAGIIGKTLHDRRDRGTVQEPPQTIHQPRHQQQHRDTITIPQRPFGHQWERGDDEGRGWQGHARRDPSVLPSTCLRIHDTQRGPQRMLGGQCLERNYAFVQDLPRACGIRLRTYNGPRRGFDPSCLRQHGYRSDLRH